MTARAHALSPGTKYPRRRHPERSCAFFTHKNARQKDFARNALLVVDAATRATGGQK